MGKRGWMGGRVRYHFLWIGCFTIPDLLKWGTGSGVVAEEEEGEEEGNLATTTRVDLCFGFFNLEVDI